MAVALTGAGDAPFAVDGRAALEKVLDVMGPAARTEVERLAGRVWVHGTSAPRSRAAAVVEQALAERRVVAVTYRDRDGATTRRRVEPHLLARTGERWYLVAWCRERRAPRWFRWDRIEDADLTSEPVPDRALEVFGTPPDDAHSVRPGAPRVTPRGRTASG